MPSNVLFLDTLFPRVEADADWRKSVKQILNYEYMLREQLMYSLTNLDSRNFNEAGLEQITEPIYAALSDSKKGLTAQLELTAAGLLAQIAAGNEQIASLSLTAEGLSSQVQTLSEGVGSMQSTLNQTSSSISAIVSAVGENGAVSAASIVAAINSSGSQVLISGDHVYIQGMVTMTELSQQSSQTFINGGNIQTNTIAADCITTGTLNAGNINMSGSFSIGANGLLGWSQGSWNAPAVVLRAASGYEFVASTDGVTMSGGSYYLTCYTSGNGGVATNAPSISTGSDRRYKREITPGLADYAAAFCALRPCSFERMEDGSGTRHVGFIAQEVEAALAENGLDPAASGLLTRPHRDNPYYGLSYTEFVALNTYMIQQLYRRVEALEERMGA